MKLFQKVQRQIQRNKALYKIADDIKNFDEVLLKKRLEIFKEKVTPAFAEIGLKHWNGKYLWYGDFNEEGI